MKRLLEIAVLVPFTVFIALIVLILGIVLITTFVIFEIVTYPILVIVNGITIIGNPIGATTHAAIGFFKEYWAAIKDIRKLI